MPDDSREPLVRDVQSPEAYEPPKLDDLPTPEGPTVTSGGAVTQFSAPRDL